MHLFHLPDSILEVLADICVADDEGPYLTLVCHKFRTLVRDAAGLKAYEHLGAEAYTVFRTLSRARWACETRFLGQAHGQAFVEKDQGALQHKMMGQVPIARPALVYQARSEDEVALFRDHMPNFSKYVLWRHDLMMMSYAGRLDKLDECLDRRLSSNFAIQGDADKKRDIVHRCMNAAIQGAQFATFESLSDYMRKMLKSSPLRPYQVVGTIADTLQDSGEISQQWSLTAFHRMRHWMELLLNNQRKGTVPVLEQLIEFFDETWRSKLLHSAPNAPEPAANPIAIRLLAMCLLLRFGCWSVDDSYFQKALELRETLADMKHLRFPDGTLSNKISLTQEDLDGLPMKSWKDFNELASLNMAVFTRTLMRFNMKMHWFGRFFIPGNDLQRANIDCCDLSAKELVNPTRKASVVQLENRVCISLASLAYHYKEMAVDGDSFDHIIKSQPKLRHYNPLPTVWGPSLLQRGLPCTEGHRLVLLEHLRWKLSLLENAFQSYYLHETRSIFEVQSYAKTLRFCISELLLWHWSDAGDDFQKLCLTAARFDPLIVFAAFEDVLSQIGRWPEECRDAAKEGVRSFLWFYGCAPLFMMLVYNDYCLQAQAVLRWKIDDKPILQVPEMPEKGRKMAIAVVIAFGDRELLEGLNRTSVTMEDLCIALQHENPWMIRSIANEWDIAERLGDKRLMQQMCRGLPKTTLDIFYEELLGWIAPTHESLKWLHQERQKPNAAAKKRLPPSLQPPPEMSDVQKYMISHLKPELRKFELVEPYLGKLLLPTPTSPSRPVAQYF